ncbi:MAG: hypothetical protein QM817_42115 [Archangium sp.]
MRIGYVPISATMTSPGDRRRFVYWARTRGVEFEPATPTGNYDVVVVSSAADVTQWARVKSAKLVFDLVDSYFAIPRSDWRGLLRGTAKFVSRQHRFFEPDHWKALAQMCRRSEAVVCSTEEQRRDISRFNENVHVILDVHSAATRTSKVDYAPHQPFRFVWEGLPFTLPQLFALAPVLAALPQPWELHVVTNPTAPRWLARFGKLDVRQALARVFPTAVFHVWTDDTFANVVTACDLALIPLDLDDPFTRGKPENKLLLFWRVGLPVAAAASPAYERAMKATGFGLASRDANEWATTLRRLMTDQRLREQSASAGRAWAEREHSEQKILERWDAVMASVGVTA